MLALHRQTEDLAASLSAPTAGLVVGDVSSLAMHTAIAQPRVPTGLFLIHPAHATKLGDALAFEANTRMRGAPTSEYWGYKIDQGAAIIPVMGQLISRGQFAGTMMGHTSYEGLRAEIRRAANDDNVDKIILAIDSPGGMVSGIDAVTEEIRAAAAKKTVVAYVEGIAASAAYWIASQAHSIVATPMSELGSIGVLALHADVSEAMTNMGVKMTAIYSGAHKVDGNPYEPLPDTVRMSMQKDVDALRYQFATAIEGGRTGRISRQDALMTEAQMYSAQEAVMMGLADYIGTLDAVVETPAGFFSGRNFASAIKEPDMDLSDAVAAKAAEGAGAVAAAPVVAPPAPAPAVATVNVADAVAAERARSAAILGSDEAKGREALAMHIAHNTDMSAEAAVALLAVSPKETAAATAQPAPPSVEQRAQNLAGLTINGKSANQDDVASLWDRVAAKSNARRGFAS